MSVAWRSNAAASDLADFKRRFDAGLVAPLPAKPKKPSKGKLLPAPGCHLTYTHDDRGRQVRVALRLPPPDTRENLTAKSPEVRGHKRVVQGVGGRAIASVIHTHPQADATIIRENNRMDLVTRAKRGASIAVREDPSGGPVQPVEWVTAESAVADKAAWRDAMLPKQVFSDGTDTGDYKSPVDTVATGEAGAFYASNTLAMEAQITLGHALQGEGRPSAPCRRPSGAMHKRVGSQSGISAGPKVPVEYEPTLDEILDERYMREIKKISRQLAPGAKRPLTVEERSKLERCKASMMKMLTPA